MPDEQATPPRWRQRLIPKTALGISMIILAAALGSAFSGAVLYSYYDYRQRCHYHGSDRKYY